MGKRKASSDAPSWIKFTKDGFLLNSEVTADFFGVTPRTLSDWAKKGAPKAARGWWNPKEIMEWLGKSDKSGELSWEARKLKADAEYREEKAKREKRLNDVLEGKYLPADEIEDEWARRVTEVKTGLFGLVNTTVSQFTDPDIRLVVERVLRDEIYELLEQYSRDGAYTPKKTNKGRKG